jgi:hypothetical protein
VTPDENRAQLEAMGFTSDRIRDELANQVDAPSFTLRRVVALQDGTELPWGDESGFTTAICGFGDIPDVWATIDLKQLTHMARAAFTGTIADHRRHEDDLAGFLHAHGVYESPSDLLAQPADVMFSDRLIARSDLPDGDRQGD